MLKVLLILEDSILDAKFDKESGKWKVSAADNHTGMEHQAEVTTEQLGAIAALGIGGEDGIFDPAARINQDHTLNHQLYDVAEVAVKDWPRECRPIP